jgi:hypothetical protein
MCGVGTVTAPAGRVARLGGRDAAARHLWRSVTLTHRAGTMSGHVCPACSQAREAAGSWGPSAVEGAYAGHLDATGQDAAMLRARIHDGVAPPLPTFGALVVDAMTAGAAVPAPSSEPWAHLRRVVDRL